MRLLRELMNHFFKLLYNFKKLSFITFGLISSYFGYQAKINNQAIDKLIKREIKLIEKYATISDDEFEANRKEIFLSCYKIANDRALLAIRNGAETNKGPCFSIPKETKNLLIKQEQNSMFETIKYNHSQEKIIKKYIENPNLDIDSIDLELDRLNSNFRKKADLLLLLVIPATQKNKNNFQKNKTSDLNTLEQLNGSEQFFEINDDQYVNKLHKEIIINRRQRIKNIMNTHKDFISLMDLE